MLYILIFLSQLFFNLIRLIGIKHGNEGDMKESLIVAFIMQVLWLLTSYFGVISIMNNDALGVLIYLVGGLVGTYIGIKYVKKYNEKDKNEKE